MAECLKLKPEAIPSTFEVQPLRPGQVHRDEMQCDSCGLRWIDSIVTAFTPTPNGRCPFEYYHQYRYEEEMDFGNARLTRPGQSVLDTIKLFKYGFESEYGNGFYFEGRDGFLYWASFGKPERCAPNGWMVRKLPAAPSMEVYPIDYTI